MRTEAVLVVRYNTEFLEILADLIKIRYELRTHRHTEIFLEIPVDLKTCKITLALFPGIPAWPVHLPARRAERDPGYTSDESCPGGQSYKHTRRIKHRIQAFQ